MTGWLLVGGLVAAAVSAPSFEIERGGAYGARVAGGDETETITVLFVRRRDARTYEEFRSVLLGERLGPLVADGDTVRRRSDRAEIEGEEESSAASMDTAWHVANSLLGRKGGEVRLIVTEVEEGSPAERAGMQRGDVIEEIEEWRWPAWRVGWSRGVARGLEDGEVQLVVSRGEKRGRLVVKLERDVWSEESQQPFGASSLGADVREVVVVADRPLLVTRGGVSGSSAGLAYALLYLEHLDPGRLLPMEVSATGSLDAGGGVGGVAGVEMKAEAAAAAGASVLFVPREDQAAAVGFPGEVVVVGTLHQAVEWLCENGATAKLCSRFE